MRKIKEAAYKCNWFKEIPQGSIWAEHIRKSMDKGYEKIQELKHLPSSSHPQKMW